MYIGLFLLIVLWILSRLTDAFSCTVLALHIKKKRHQTALSPAYKMFIALAVDSFITSLLIISVVPYLALAWNPPPAWSLPWLGTAAITSASFKTYTKFKVAYGILTKGN